MTLARVGSLVLVAALFGCPGGGSGSTDGGAGGGTGAATGGGGGSTDAGADGGAPASCIEVQLQNFAFRRAYPRYVSFVADVTPDLGDAGRDLLSFELYDDLDAGTFDLASPVDRNYATCSRCFRVLQDDGAAVFFQQRGTLTLGASDAGALADGNLSAVVSELTLVEVLIDPNTNISTPVTFAPCLHVTNAVIEVVHQPAPVGWSCDAQSYDNGECTCGCGVVDVDCAGADLEACDFCADHGSCIEALLDAGAAPATPAADGGVRAAGCGYVDPANNAVCQPPPTVDAGAENDAGAGSDAGADIDAGGP